MSVLRRASRFSKYRCEPRLELLESRRLFAVSTGTSFATIGPIAPAALTTSVGLDPGLSGTATDLSTLSVVQTTPGNGAVLNESPTTLEITFNQPFSSFSLGIDIGLQRIDADGNVLEDLTGSLFEPFDIGQDDTSVLPVTIGTNLGFGRYQIVLLGSTSILTGVGTDGNPGAPLINSGVDEVLSTFTIAPPGSDPGPDPDPSPKVDPAQTLPAANDLGFVGNVPTVTSATLDLSSNSGNYHLYKFSLAPGHFWRIGAEVTAQRDGGTLDAALALFDAQGHVIKTADSGRSDANHDPYLFAGLQPGTYYLGVSGSLDTPGQAGGYDPVAGLFGSIGLAQDGGRYQLHLVADMADASTTLLDSQLIYSDPLDPRPTGIVVVFSGAMDLDSFLNSIDSGGNGGFKGLEVVDQSGRTWPLTPTSYNERNSEFSFLFNTPLPKGHYTLRVPAQGGVTDLTGRPPVASGRGQSVNPVGVLATWTVNKDYSPQSANNLGTILNDANGAHPLTGTLAAGESVSYRFVVPASGFFGLESTYSSPSFRIELIGRDGTTTTLQSGDWSGFSASFFNIKPGVYQIRCLDIGSEPIDFSLTLYRKSSTTQAILDNGVGQGPALNLALITPVGLSAENATPTPVASSVIAGPAPLAGEVTPVGLPHLAIAPGQNAAPSTTEFVSSSSTTGLVLTLGNGLVGSPIAGAEQVAAVGPAIRTGDTALAALTPSVLQGITYGQSLPRFPANLSGESLLDSNDLPVPSEELEAPVDGALSVVADPPGPNQNERVIASSSDWFGGLGATLLNWFASTAPAPTTMEPAPRPDEPIEPIFLVRDDLVPSDSEEREEHADLAAPLGLSVVSVMVLRLQRPIRRWIGRRKGRGAMRRQAGRASVQGPHKRS